MKSRREFLAAGATARRACWPRAPVSAPRDSPRSSRSAPPTGTCNSKAIPPASHWRRNGFDGVQISLSNKNGKDWIGDAVLDQFVAESKRLKLPIASVCLNILHKNFLKSDPKGPQRVADAIPMAKRVGVEVILLPFFGPGALKTVEEMDYVGDILKEIGPQAQKAGVILGLEDTISARNNVRIMERSQSTAVLMYYNVGNSTLQGFNVIDEIRWLGIERICEVHLKDNPHYLGEGTIDFPGIVAALTDIGYSRWAQLETDTPKGVKEDMTKNLAYIRKLTSASA